MQKVAKWFGLLMVPVYVGIGCLFIFSSAMLDLVPTNRNMIGVVFIIYGMFRLYMSLRLFKNRQQINEKENS